MKSIVSEGLMKIANPATITPVVILIYGGALSNPSTSQ